VYHKTGTIEGIVNDAGIIEIATDNHVVVVVLIKRIAAGASSEAGTVIANIAKAAFDTWR
jgi:D-alanyl-D-alanine carboxypeptidase